MECSTQKKTVDCPEWGINIYQAVSYDLQTENAQMLPSYIYYGVSSKEAVIVSKLGVPRLAVNNVIKMLKVKLLRRANQYRIYG